MRTLGGVALFVSGAKVGADEVPRTARVVAIKPLLGVICRSVDSVRVRVMARVQWKAEVYLREAT